MSDTPSTPPIPPAQPPPPPVSAAVPAQAAQVPAPAATATPARHAASSPNHSPRSGRNPWDPTNIAIAVAILFTAYLLSFGPVAAYYAEYPRHKYTWHHSIAIYLYKPIQFTVQRIPPLDAPTAEYIKFWIKVMQTGSRKYSRDPMEMFYEGRIVG